MVHTSVFKPSERYIYSSSCRLRRHLRVRCLWASDWYMVCVQVRLFNINIVVAVSSSQSWASDTLLYQYSMIDRSQYYYWYHRPLISSPIPAELSPSTWTADVYIVCSIILSSDPCYLPSMIIGRGVEIVAINHHDISTGLRTTICVRIICYRAYSTILPNSQHQSSIQSHQL